MGCQDINGDFESVRVQLVVSKRPAEGREAHEVAERVQQEYGDKVPRTQQHKRGIRTKHSGVPHLE